MHFIGAVIGLLLGMAVWFAASHLVASSILWAENRYPNRVGSKGLRACEALACGLLVLACFAIAVWVMRHITW